MSSPLDTLKKATAAVAIFAGDVKVSAFAHRAIAIVAAAAAAAATFTGENSVLLGLTPEQVVYAGAAATLVATVARIFIPKD